MPLKVCLEILKMYIFHKCLVRNAIGAFDFFTFFILPYLKKSKEKTYPIFCANERSVLTNTALRDIIYTVAVTGALGRVRSRLICGYADTFDTLRVQKSVRGRKSEG